MTEESEPRGWLRVVATPIGNLEDLTPRAVRAFTEASVILAEDTRRARQLLTHLGIAGKRIARLDAHAERFAVARWVELVRTGARIAMVSDAGTPGVSDPGAAVVRAAAELGLTVESIPGASAVIAALAASGMPADRFRFFGFLPRKGGARRSAIAELLATEETVVFFEAPQRAARTLAELASLAPERGACVARELTKMHEELVRGTLAEVSLRVEWRGEITVVLGPAVREHVLDEAAIEARITELLAAGLRSKEVARTVAAELSVSAREVYKMMLARAPVEAL
ncbi:MAG: 16S rRNA (cytidine(1402)-2'-O)-methyltransferase [Myxococcales bacterium]|nr:16S rRNA (cytidine(1402)-2'-O)-methyltransferase [Myxococcales bacterium]